MCHEKLVWSGELNIIPRKNENVWIQKIRVTILDVMWSLDDRVVNLFIDPDYINIFEEVDE